MLDWEQRGTHHTRVPPGKDHKQISATASKGEEMLNRHLPQNPAINEDGCRDRDKDGGGELRNGVNVASSVTTCYGVPAIIITIIMSGR